MKQGLVRDNEERGLRRWWPPAVVAGTTVISSVVLPLLINEASESERAGWVRPAVAVVTFTIAMQAVRVERRRTRQRTVRRNEVEGVRRGPPPARLQGAATQSAERHPRVVCNRREAPGDPGTAGQVERLGTGLDRRDGGSVGLTARISPRPAGPLIDRGTAQAARVYDYLLGGVNNFEVDRQLAAKIYASAGGVENARLRVRANREFLGRAVRYLAGEAGIRQFLDLGTGIPHADNVHGIAQATAPDARVVYVDHDPVVLAHAHTLRSSSPLGATTFIYGDLRDDEQVLHQAAQTLDFSSPIALVIVGVLHHFRDDERPEIIVRRYLDALPPGSYLVLENIGKESDDVARLGELIENLPDAHFTLVPRTRAEMVRFFDGTEVIEPGVVFVDQWRPDGALPSYETRHPCGVGRKP